MKSPTKFDYDSIHGDYQFRALREGYRLQRFWHSRKIQLIQHLVLTCPNRRLLEIGCGSGNLLYPFANKFETIYGIDINQSAVRFCKQYSMDMGYTNMHFPIGSTYALPFPEFQFHIVLLCDVIEHLEQPLSCLKEAWRVLMPGGQLIITTPNYRSFWPILERVIDWAHLTPPMKDEQHISPLNRGLISTYLSDIGFHDIQVGSVFMTSLFAALFSNKLAERLFCRELAGLSLPGALLYAVGIKLNTEI